MFIQRDLSSVLERFKAFPVIAILGPRQSGKTTLAQHYFKDHIFLSLEKPSTLMFAKTDPEGFLRANANPHGMIIDEFQYVPELLSYIQLLVDQDNRPSYFVLTGSQNFLVNQAITQSLAGRVGILTLLPLSINELERSGLLAAQASDAMVKGFYPRLYSSEMRAPDFYDSYIHTYVEKDVRQLVQVGDLQTFQKFLALCAGRIGQILNLSELAMVCGISEPAAKRWLSILEASYIIFLLQPHFNNFNKRLIKRPKLYFYDPGLAANLLNVPTSAILNQSIFKGPLFENLIIADLLKQFHNQGRRPSLYFWRDNNGRIEIDGLVDLGVKLVPIEVKASETISTGWFEAMGQWNEISETQAADNYVVYAGPENQVRMAGQIVSWQSVGQLLQKIESKI